MSQWADLVTIPSWDFGLAEYPESTKTFDFGELGRWLYCTEAPSLWPIPKDGESISEIEFALSILGGSRRSAYIPRQTASLHTLTIANTLSCNLGCTYCYNFSAFGQRSHPKDAHIDSATALSAIAFLFENSPAGSPLTFQFIGGEPLMHWDSLRLCIEAATHRAALEARRVRFALNTNAILLTRDKLEWFSTCPIQIFISYDGPPQSHDQHRLTILGRPSFHLVERGIQAYMAYYRNDLKSCRMTMDFERGCFSNLISDAVQRGFNDIAIGFDSVALSRRPDLLQDLLKDLPIVERVCYDLLVEQRLRRFSWFNELWRQLTTGTAKYRACAAADGYLATDPSGSLYPCHRYVGSSNNVMATLEDTSVPSCPPRFTENLENEDCNHCWARRVCGGECFAVLDDIQRETRKKQSLCILRRAIFESALRLFAKLKINHPEIMTQLLESSNAMGQLE